MAIVSVSSTAGLLNALKTAKGGDTITLQAGSYSDVNLRNIDIAGGVTITSANASKPAVLNDLMLRDSKNITFTNLEFVVDPKKGYYPFEVDRASNIKFDNLYVHGSLNGSSADDGDGMLIRNSSNVSVVNSKFEQLSHGINHLDSNGITLSANKFSYINNDGIRGGGTSNLKVTDNYFTNFDHVGDEHPDAIQVWTANTTKVATDITITGNVVDRGTGYQIQGIWMRDEVGNLPFDRVTIANNTIVGAQYNGIGVQGATNIAIKNNTVLGMDDQQSWIRIEKASAAVVTDNVASGYTYINSNAVKSANVQMANASKATAAALSSWVQKNASVSGLASKLSAQIFDSVQLAGYIDQPVSAVANAARPAGAIVNSIASKFSETVINGTAGADRLTVGTVGDFRLEGGAGDDVLTGGGSGTNKLVGGAGNDTYVVYSARDLVIEGVNGGTDTVCNHVDYTLGANVENARVQVAGLTTTGNELNNIISGTSGKDILYGMGGDDMLQGGGGDDVLYGGAGNDVLKGDDGNDILWAGTGNDVLYGGAGDDILYAESGTNNLVGGAGRDTLVGGTGQDFFLFYDADFAAGVDASMDKILNFSSVQKDKIALNAMDANVNTAVNDAFSFIGTSAFHKVAGELRYEVSGKDAYVMGDTNGDGVADFKIHVVGVTSFTAQDFYL